MAYAEERLSLNRRKAQQKNSEEERESKVIQAQVTKHHRELEELVQLGLLEGSVV
jgi:hypothetical protein